MTDYFCAHSCRITIPSDADIIKYFDADERAYCAFCTHKKPMDEGGFYCWLFREDKIPMLKEMVEKREGV